MSSTSDSTLETLHLFRLIADVSAYIMISTGIITFIFAIKSGLLGAGYGRHYQKPKETESETKTWSKDLSNVGVLFSFKNGWIIQESGSVLSSLAVLLVCYFNFPEIFSLFTQRVYLVGAWVYLLPFYIHYVHRAWIYPCFTNSKQPISCGIMSLALLFCSWNGFQQTLSAIGHFYDSENPNILGTGEEINDQHNFVMPNLLGLPIFFLGMGINLHADYHLIGLKNEGNGYQIPNSGLFKLITCPNYFGEFVEWFGYAMFCNFSLSSIAFVVFTMGNLVPRAIKNHRWYHEKFPDYPKNRKVVFPFVY